MLSRRNAMFAASGFIAIALAPRLSFAEAATATTSAAVGPFSLEPLPYPANALEPFIDARTMELHHGQHHAAYVSNLNAIVKDHPQIVDMAPLARISHTKKAHRGAESAKVVLRERLLTDLRNRPDADRV